MDYSPRQDPNLQAEWEQCECGGEYVLNDYCGCEVCSECSDHKGLARCYCGWAASGGDGRTELEELGETIDP